MTITSKAKAYHERMFPDYKSSFLETDPEFIEIFDNFAFDEVINNDDLSEHTRMICILSVLIGCQGIDEFKSMLIASYNLGVTPIEMKEIVYQATAYLGIGRTFPFLKAVNEFCINNKIKLPLEGQSTTTREDRLIKGNQAQIDIFGDSMIDYYKKGDPVHINYWLCDNCFGDYYTRKGLDYKQREMITFCFLYAQGGCEPQLKGHIEANIRLGNDKDFLIKVLSQCLPYIGYPRTLNALRCVEEAKEDVK